MEIKVNEALFDNRGEEEEEKVEEKVEENREMFGEVKNLFRA